MATIALCRRITTSISAPCGRNGTGLPRMSNHARRRDTSHLYLGASNQTLSTRSSVRDAQGRLHKSGRTSVRARSIRHRRQSSTRGGPAQAGIAGPTSRTADEPPRDTVPDRGGRLETRPRHPHLRAPRRGQGGPHKGRQRSPAHPLTRAL